MNNEIPILNFIIAFCFGEINLLRILNESFSALVSGKNMAFTLHAPYPDCTILFMASVLDPTCNFS